MKVTPRSSLVDVALIVGNALRRAGVRGTLTGGACASLYTRGAYTSVDVDFVLTEPPTLDVLDSVMVSVGFTRKRDHYVHPAVPFFVEFPVGPLGIGADFAIRPVMRSRGPAKTLALSATDSCRDRLAAFYHWGDRQSLSVAVAIAIRNRVSQAAIRRWSEAEGQMTAYSAFLAELQRARASRRRSVGANRSARR